MNSKLTLKLLEKGTVNIDNLKGNKLYREKIHIPTISILKPSTNVRVYANIQLNFNPLKYTKYKKLSPLYPTGYISIPD